MWGILITLFSVKWGSGGVLCGGILFTVFSVKDLFTDYHYNSLIANYCSTLNFKSALT